MNSQGLDVVGTVGTSRKVRQVKLNLIPAIVEPHGHGTNERLDSSSTLIVAGSEASAHILVVKHLNLERKVLFQVLDDHNEKWKLDAESLLRIGRTCDVRGAHVGAHDLEHQRLNVVVGDALNVTVSHFLVPDLQRLGAYAVQNGEKSALECVLEHFFFFFQSLLFSIRRVYISKITRYLYNKKKQRTI